jgi:hypothetical protein
MNPVIAQKIADAARPLTVDTEGACEIVEKIEGRKPSGETVRRWPIPYKLIGRTRVYEVDHVIGFSCARFDKAPIRRAAAQRRSAIEPAA